MGKRLNIEALSEAMSRKGLNSSQLAQALKVSREAVSKWLNNENLPKPDKLLKLALQLGLSLEQLIVGAENGSEPVVAFRKMGSKRTTDQHISRAKEMGRLLRPLVSYLPFDKLVRPPTLKTPKTGYEYIQNVVAKIRKEIGLAIDEPLDFHHLIKKFTELQAVLIPVLWGRKDRHENALHIFLPDSMTTWVYLNLDSEVHDFKFWMAHELGHILAPELRGDVAEDFADAFAGALLFPEKRAKWAWEYVSEASKQSIQINRLKEIAEENLISPISVYMEINNYASHNKLTTLNLEPAIFGAARNLSKAYHNISSSLFDGQMPSPEKYIYVVEKLFESPFFKVLKKYLIKEKKGPGYIQVILDIPLLDARTLYQELGNL